MQQQQQTERGNTVERRRIPKLMVGVLGGQPLRRGIRMRRNCAVCCSSRAKKIREDPGWDLFFPWSSILMLVAADRSRPSNSVEPTLVGNNRNDPLRGLWFCEIDPTAQDDSLRARVQVALLV